MEVTQVSFAPRQYLVWRKTIAIKDITNQQMWGDAFAKVGKYTGEQQIEVVGPGAGLYLTWDEERGTTDMAIGLMVGGDIQVDHSDLSLITLPQSMAAHTVVHGGYDKLREAHGAIHRFLREHGIQSAVAVEEYAVTGMDNPDSEAWETNLYYTY